jgi:uncharacterized glyoxalase superfamily protein PhnB
MSTVASPRKERPMRKASAKQVMPIITVESADKARNFFVDTLGFDHVMGVLGKDGQLDFVTVVLNGARLMFARPHDNLPLTKAGRGKQPVEIYLEVADVAAYHEKLKKKGVKITDTLTMQWWGDRTFKVMDPFGYEVWFYQTVGEPRPPEGAKIV